MEVSIIEKNQVTITELPEKIRGRFPINRKNAQGLLEPLLYVEGQNGSWNIINEGNLKIIPQASSPIQDANSIVDDSFFTVKNGIDTCFLTAEETSLDILTFKKYKIPNNGVITIGGGEGNDIQYKNVYMDKRHARIIYRRLPNSNNYQVTFEEIGDSGKGTKSPNFINLEKVTQSNMKYGDMFYFMGLKIIVTRDYVAVNNPNHNVVVNLQPFEESKASSFNRDKSIPETSFSLSPRKYTKNKNLTVAPDQPPVETNQKNAPWLFMYGPSIAMGLATLCTSVYSVNNIIQSNGDLTGAIPSLLIAVAMLFGTIICPFLARSWEKRTYKVEQRKAQEEYLAEIRELESEINEHKISEINTLNNNNPDLAHLISTINTVDHSLWERETRHDDFLDVTVGKGNTIQDVTIKAPSIPKNTIPDVKKGLNFFIEKDRILENVPINISFEKDNFVGIVGNRKKVKDLTKALILELIAQHSYDDLKLAFIYDLDEKKDWEFTKWLPHAWSNNKEENYIATNFDQLKDLSNRISSIIALREKKNESEIEYETPHFVIFACNRTLAEKAFALKKLYSLNKNIRISVVALYDEKKNLPRNFNKYIQIGNNDTKIIDLSNTTDEPVRITSTNQLNQDLSSIAIKLANIQLDIPTTENNLPEQFTLMDMFKVKEPEDYNVSTKWEENDVTKSMAVPLGIDSDGYPIVLDIHEKAHGPHGLIAGMTGSGKSELIISYISSLAMNFSPEDVAFVLVDFKGGGMGDTFQDLPHTIGTVTNLDGNELNRSLLAIESELVRRQEVLKEASKKYDISNIDIYRYQQIRKEQKENHEEDVPEPLPHLVIIVDEFAELKQQNPDFLDQLIRIARIGRSLGVHMILATQKPDGVVNDQIMSNIRFKVCLKVQSIADSRSMLGSPEAAMLNKTGQFYLQVGVNEIFELGKAAWAGAPFIEDSQFDSSHVYSIDIYDENNNKLDSLDTSVLIPKDVKAVKQVDKVVDYLSESANEMGLEKRMLWIPPLAPPQIREVEDETEAENGEVSVQVGQYDDVIHQRYEPLMVDFSKEGNAIVYGATGSGKLEFLNKLIYELISNFSKDDLQINLLDMDTGSLTAFSGAPQIDNVLLSYDIDRTKSFFEDLENEVENRKRLFMEYGGDFEQYNKNSGNKVPAIINVLDNYSNFNHLLDEMGGDLIENVTREGTKLGIYFIVTTSTYNSIGYRLTPNFRQIFTLQQNNEDEYFNILGRHDNMIPSNYVGRGLIKRSGKTYEFQVDIPFAQEKNRFEAIKEYSNSLVGSNPERVAKTKVITKQEFLNDLGAFTSSNITLGLDGEKLLEFDNPEGIVPIIYSEEFQPINREFIKDQFRMGDFDLNFVEKPIIGDQDLQAVYHTYMKEIEDLFKERYKIAIEAQKRGEKIPSFEPVGYFIPDYNEFLAELPYDDYINWSGFFQHLTPVFNITVYCMTSADRSEELMKMLYQGVDKANIIWLGNKFDNFNWYKKLSDDQRKDLNNDGITIQKDDFFKFGKVPA